MKAKLHLPAVLLFLAPGPEAALQMQFIVAALKGGEKCRVWGLLE